MSSRTTLLYLIPQFIAMFSVLICSQGLKKEAAEVSSLNLSSVLKPADSISLLSGNGIFAAGFIPAGAPGAYAFGIWYAARPDFTVVWLANRDRSVDRNSSLALTQKGNMVLSTSNGTVVWATNTSDQGVNKAVLQESGSLVLLGASGGGSPVWQSFDHPTDTLLPMQRFLRVMALVSKKSENTYSSGDYKLSFNSENRLTLIDTGEAVAAPDVYWVDLDSVDKSQQRGGGGELIIANAGMNTTGGIIISDGINFMASDFGEGPLRRLTMGFDGNLRIHSWNQNSSSWIIVWMAIQQHCKIYGMCGPNSFCVDKLADDTHICKCPPGFHAKNNTDISLSLGCEPNINVVMNCTSTHVQNFTSYKFISLEFVNYRGHDLLSLSSATLKECETACRNNCSCVGFYYTYDQVSWKVLDSQNCYLKAKLLNGYQSPDAGKMFIKVSALESAQTDINSTNSMNLICLPDVHLYYPKLGYGSQEVVRIVSVSSSILILEIIVGAAAAYFLIAKYIILREARRYDLDILSGRPKKFTYAEVEAATNNFSEIMGKGGYGTVYRGYLPDQTLIAVKRIDRLSQEEEFWAEVTIICRIHHLNLVRMRGFCAQGEHKLLVYEYVPNGSLDTHLFSATCTLDWKKRYQIALGIARGIAYLHEECLEWILHCDIKPQNVLLDDNFCPKISDFGVSKLVDRETALNVSQIRGTRGYLAPEWMQFDQPISAKADVYSFGMVLLEIISGRKNFEITQSPMDEDHENMTWCFPVSAHKLLREGKLKEAVDGRIADDPEIRWDEVERVIKTAFWCIQSEANLRPSMGKVVQMLAGKVHVDEPLNVNFFSFLQDIESSRPLKMHS